MDMIVNLITSNKNLRNFGLDLKIEEVGKIFEEV